MADPKTVDSYNQKAERYENRWKDYLLHTHQKFLSLIQTGPKDIILDASCGTGLLATEIIKLGFPFKELVLNDISGKMLLAAKDRLAGIKSISYSQSPVTNLPFNDDHFTSLFCLNAFHNYDDHSQVLREFNRLLGDGGDLYILDWNREGWFRFINKLIQWYVPETINTCSATEIELLLRREGFDLLKMNTWYYKYWNFFAVKAHKKAD